MHMVDSVAMSFLSWLSDYFSLPVSEILIFLSLPLPQTAASKQYKQNGVNLLRKSSIHPSMQRLGRRNNLPSSQSGISLLWLLPLGSPHNKSLSVFQFVHEFVCHKSVE